MKTHLLVFIFVCLMTSCATVFTRSKQPITFSGIEGIKIYDTATNIKIAEIGSDQTVTVSFRKKLFDKHLVAKKEGYRPYPFILESTFNPISLWNVIVWPGFIIDIGTSKINKWEHTYISIDLEKE